MKSCPYCHWPVVEVTCSDDEVQRYLCTGPEVHEWRGALPDEETGEPIEPLVILSK